MATWDESLEKALNFLTEAMVETDSSIKNSLLSDAAEVYTGMLKKRYSKHKKAVLYVSRAFTHITRQQFWEAKEDLNEAVNYDPDIPMTYVELGYVNVQLGNNKLAAEAYINAVQLFEEIGVENLGKSDLLTAIRAEKGLDYLCNEIENDFEFHALSKGIISRSEFDNTFGKDEEEKPIGVFSSIILQ